jgi:hypothetical protein
VLDGSGRATISAARLTGPATVAADRFTLDLKSAAWKKGRLDLTGGLSAAALTVTEEARTLTAAALRWSGRVAVDGSPTPVHADGKLELDSARLTLPDINATLGRLRAEGLIESSPPGAALPVTLRLGLTGEKIAANAASGARDWLAIERIEAVGFTLAGDGGLGAERIGVDGLAALRRGGTAGYPWRIEARTLRLDQPRYDGGTALAATEARASALTVRLSRTEAGWLGYPRPPRTKAGAGPAAQPLSLALGRLTVSGNSRLVFEDRSLDEPVRLEARPLDLTVTQIDTSRPGHDSPFDLTATVGAATVTASGTLRPFAADPGGRVDARITALELPPFSPYLAQALGINLRTGHFSGTVKGEVKNGAIDGAIDLTLSNLFVAQPDPNAPLARKTGMPVETMLDLLRGSDDRIRLSIPVRGRLDSPDFDVSDAVAQAVAGAVTSTVMTTLKVAFPLTALFSLVMDSGDNGRVALAPLGFPAGAAALGDEQRQILDQVATLLRGRPGLRLTLCGKATVQEGAALAARRRAEERPILSRLERWVGADQPPADSSIDRDGLSRLADRRAAKAKEYLVEQADIAAERLFTCRSEIEETGDKGPRVDLLL